MQVTPIFASLTPDFPCRLPFRLLLDSDGWSGDPAVAQKQKAIEIWSLYSYNLHKATYHGLHEASGALAWREGRRNFIIGRGSFAEARRARTRCKQAQTTRRRVNLVTIACASPGVQIVQALPRKVIRACHHSLTGREYG